MNNICTKFLLLTLMLTLQGCALFWPYKSDFDCPIPEGEQCRSLYEINKMADEGKYYPQEDSISKTCTKRKSEKSEKVGS